MNNFLKSAPPWLSNLFAIVLTALVFVNTIGPDVIKLFTDLDCQSCIAIANTVLGVSGTILGILKAFSASSTSDSNITDNISKKTTALVLIISLFAYQGFAYKGNFRENRLKNKPPTEMLRNDKYPHKVSTLSIHISA